MILAGIVFGLADGFALLTLARHRRHNQPQRKRGWAFLPIEQAGLTQTISDQQRTQVFAWYNLSGSAATALGALVGGFIAQILQGAGAHL
jgi:MFS family permease